MNIVHFTPTRIYSEGKIKNLANLNVTGYDIQSA